jgi:hypothetical protein
MEQRRPWTWPWLVACTVARAALASVLCLALWGAVPALFGWQPTTVSSGSMLPRLHVGDVAVSRPLHGAAPTLGSVLLFDDPDHPGRLRLHRFVRVDDVGRLVTRGDANTGDDSSPVPLAAVHGVGTLRVPWVALPVVWFRERSFAPLGLVVVGLVGLALVAGQGHRFGFDEDQPSDPPGDGGAGTGPSGEPAAPAEVAGARPGQAHRATTGRHGPAALVGAAGVAALLAGLGAVPAGAAFSDRTSSRVSLAAAPYFRCTGAVAGASPYLWFRLDESSVALTAADSSGAGRHGVYGLLGKTKVADHACADDTGSAMRFDGNLGYLSSAQLSSAPQVFTVALWFKTTTDRGGKLVGYGNARTGPSGIFDRHLYLTDEGRVVFGVYVDGTRTISSRDSYRDGRWHQAVASVSAAGMRLYLDGALVAADAAVTSAEPAPAGYLRVGYDNLDGWPNAPRSRYFAGTLDEVAFYLRALSAAEVKAQFDAAG